IDFMTQTPSNLSPWRKILRRPYLIVATAFLIFNGLRFMIIRDFSEWTKVYVLAGNQLIHGADIYALLPIAENHAYSYPPFMAMLAIPFSFLPVQLSVLLWFLINAICAVIVWKWSWRLSGGMPLGGDQPAPFSEHLICILGLLCEMRFMQDNFNHR